LMKHGGRNCCNFFPDVLFEIHRCPCFLFIHPALEISSEEEVLRLGTLFRMNIEVPTNYPLSQDRIIVFEIRLHSKSPMLYRPMLHGNWNALGLARGALKEKFPTPTVPLTAVMQNRQVFLADPILCNTVCCLSCKAYREEALKGFLCFLVMEISDEILPFRIWCNEILNMMNKCMCLEVCSKQYEPIHSNISTLFATNHIPKDA
jgi:hypothetical protein